MIVTAASAAPDHYAGQPIHRLITLAFPQPCDDNTLGAAITAAGPALHAELRPRVPRSTGRRRGERRELLERGRSDLD